MSHDPEEGVRVSAPAATLFGLSALLLSISMVLPHFAGFVVRLLLDQRLPSYSDFVQILTQIWP